MFETFYRAVRELQSSKMKCLRQNAQSARDYMSETVDLRGLPLSASTSEPKKTHWTSFQQNQKWPGVKSAFHWSRSVVHDRWNAPAASVLLIHWQSLARIFPLWCSLLVKTVLCGVKNKTDKVAVPNTTRDCLNVAGVHLLVSSV